MRRTVQTKSLEVRWQAPTSLLHVYRKLLVRYAVSESGQDAFKIMDHSVSNMAKALRSGRTAGNYSSGFVHIIVSGSMANFTLTYEIDIKP